MNDTSQTAETAARRAQLARLLPLHNPIQHYAWGSRSALAELAGRPHPSSEPEAELWIGAHPKAPSRVELSGREVGLDQLLALRPVELLGVPTVRRYGPSLPFLLKILAADQPLSIQAHPDNERARLGFARENAAGLDREAPERCYRDPNPKRELVFALSEFPVLSGFRKRDQSLELLGRLQLEQVEPLRRLLAREPASTGLRELLAALLSDRVEPNALAAAVAERAATLDSEPFRWVTRLAKFYPGDPAILAPLFLELIKLEPGEALFTETGTLHSYLGGTAIELMTNSDNVLRAGLTSKFVDCEGLLEVLRFEEAPATRPAASSLGEGRSLYQSPAHDLGLERLDLRVAGAVHRGAPGLEIVLCTAGAIAAEWAEGNLELKAGEALLAPAVLDEYRLSGSAIAFRVSATIP